MYFQPTPEELAEAQYFLQGGSLNDSRLHLSGSEWDGHQLHALRVIALDKLSPERIIPGEYVTKVMEFQGEVVGTEWFAL